MRAEISGGVVEGQTGKDKKVALSVRPTSIHRPELNSSETLEFGRRDGDCQRSEDIERDSYMYQKALADEGRTKK